MGLTLKETVEAHDSKEIINKKNGIKEVDLKTVPQKNKTPKVKSREKQKFAKSGEVGRWFQTICWMKIPLIGFIYIIIIALSKKSSFEKKSFAKAYILYKVLVWLLAVTIMYCLYKLGLDLFDAMLKYASEQ